MKIKNIEQLQDYILDSLEKLSNNKIDVTEAGIIAKSAETVISSIKLQLSYSAMIGHTPHIDFLHNCHKGNPAKTIEQRTELKKLSRDK